MHTGHPVWHCFTVPELQFMIVLVIQYYIKILSKSYLINYCKATCRYIAMIVYVRLVRPKLLADNIILAIISWLDYYQVSMTEMLHVV